LIHNSSQTVLQADEDKKVRSLQSRSMAPLIDPFIAQLRVLTITAAPNQLHYVVLIFCA